MVAALEEVLKNPHRIANVELAVVVGVSGLLTRSHGTAAEETVEEPDSVADRDAAIRVEIAAHERPRFDPALLLKKSTRLGSARTSNASSK